MAQIDAVLDRARRGERLTLEDGLVLYDSNDIEKLGAAAHERMLAFHPEFPITTFVIGRNVNYSNVCDTYCRFCAFYRPPGHPEGYVLDEETIMQKIQELVDVGGTELLMQGGTHPNLPLEYYLDLVRKIKARFPQVDIHSFSTIEIKKMSEVSGKSIEAVLRLLKEAGLGSLPGAGAEILDDRIRLKIAKRKGSWREWIDIMETAHRVGLHTTATMVIGFGETVEERLLHMIRLRESQDRAKAIGAVGYLAFILWTFQPENTHLPARKIGAEEYLKNLAIARLMIDNIPNFQTSWVTMGPEVGKLSLSYGCNDFGSTMIEENVVSAAACTYKVNTNLILDLIREAGRIPAQRNTKYQILRIFREGERAERDFIMQN
ncbi:MAG: dehypoxanthine futalosine cyclase [Hydrogenibacillus schlegelii]|uniref:Cyclic dehypoxanthine futalosine synthase n=1 Tax=Hydrogenibacillus schlegelii TaxID=1484 RepID=A0A947CWP8_HYDSH|nr:dehypoxanthine futalosine cyclase [Hydrogenibacillus schlegelii]